MAMNLRLPADTAQALRERAASTGRSQQDLIREAVESYLGLGTETLPFRGTTADLIARGLARPPAVPYRRAKKMIVLPEGMNSLALLQREDRF